MFELAGSRGEHTMMIDWQAYLDGSLESEDRRLADEVLKNDPKARRELDGLELFVQTVRVQALQEEIPYDRLAKLIPETAVKQKRGWWMKFEFAGLAACLALAMFFVAPGLFSRPVSELITNDPVFASRWASEKQALNVPVLDLGQDAPMMRVHEGKGRCCFDYEIDGKTYHLNVRPKGTMEPRPGETITLASGQTATHGTSVRWTQGKYDLSLSGPDEKVEIDLANRASRVLQQA
jgi:hypothetical protein